MSHKWWMDIARRELGQAEVPGARNHNPRIREYLRTVGLGGGDETAWCSAGLNWCVEEAGLEGTDKGAARSWEHWGKDAPGKTLAERIVQAPFGAIVTLWREKPTGYKGHVGCKVRVDGPQIWLVGGNQGNTWSIHAFPTFRVTSVRVAA